MFFTPNGTIHDRWRPSGRDASFSFPAGSILEPVAPFQRDLIVMDRIRFDNADNHSGGMEAMLTAHGPDSIDQYLGPKISADTRFRSLELGVQTSLWGGQLEYAIGEGRAIAAARDWRRVG